MCEICRDDPPDRFALNAHAVGINDGVEVAVPLADRAHAGLAVSPADILPFDSAAEKDTDGVSEAEAAFLASSGVLHVIPLEFHIENVR